MLKKTFLLVLALLGCAWVHGGGRFEVKSDQKSYKVNFNGKPLIVNEGFTPGFAPEKTLEENLNGDTVLTAWGNSKNMPWRREVSSKYDNREVEITFQVLMSAFNAIEKNVPETPENQNALRIGDPVQHYFDIPFEVLKDCKFTAVVGRHKSNKQITGKLSSNKKDGVIIGGMVRCVAFSKKDFNLVIDFNPSGVQDLYSSYTIGSLSGFGDVRKVGDVVRFSMGSKASRNGGLHTGKYVIYQGSEQDFQFRHSHNSYGYCSELPAEKRFVFGADKFAADKVKADLHSYSAGRTFGWVESGNAAVEKFRPQGTLYAAVKGSGKALFRADLPRRGLYIVNINTGTGAEAVKGMTLALNGRELVRDLDIAAETVQKIQVPMWIENNKAEFEFSGSWRVSEIAFQLLLASSEDFSIRRGMWRGTSTDYPGALYHNEHYAQQPPYNVHLADYPLPEPGREAVGDGRMLEYTTAYGDMRPMQKRIFSAMIGSWGSGNAGTFTEFSMPGAVERNIAELQKNRINLVMFNGMLARHTFADAHKQRLHKVIGNYVQKGKAANKDFIFIDHIDYSMLWNSDSGFRHLVGWNDRLQETVDGGLPGRARCMTNPKAVNDFYNTVLEHIKQTGIDGLMVDECLFMTKNFCACAHCRKTFTADTNYHLPADELSTDLHNPKSKLWRVWEEWRRCKIGEFWVNLRKHVNTYRKDFIFIGYSTHYGLTSDWATNDMGSDLFQYARAWDMIGTEIMPRNVFASARAVNSLRKTFSLFGRNGKIPVFGLVYAADWKVKYFGWALNSLNGQQTWETTFLPCPDGEVNYRTFTAENGNMDLTRSRSAAKVALLFSETSRNLAGSIPAAGNYRQELLGTSQILNLLHIDHDIISEVDLNLERLSKYNVLMLGNSPYLPEKYLPVIRQFAENGGTVTASYMTGIADQFGQRHHHDFVSSMLGWKPGKKAPAPGKAFSVSCNGKDELKLKRELLYRQLPNIPVEPGEMVLMNRNGKKRPAVISRNVGQGRFIYFPGQYGFANCANELMVGKKYNFEPDKSMETFQKKLLSDLLDTHRVWKVLNVPEMVFTAAHYQNEYLILHFLNAVNSTPQLGEVIRYEIGKNPFPKLSGMQFEVDGKYSQAYAVSPDFDGKKPLPVQKINGALRITLPGDLLKVYTLVYIK